MEVSSSHAPPLQNLWKMYREKSLCDVVLVVSGVEFPAHRVILAACSDYFKVMFTSQMREQHLERVELKSDQLTVEAVEVLLQYAYAANLSLSPENVFDVLTAADHLQVVSAVEKCCQFVVSSCLRTQKMRVSECLSVTVYADKYSHLEYLGDSLNSTLATNFVKLMQHPETYGMLSFERLGAILDSDDLSCPSEVQILQAVLKWLRSDPGNRMQYATRILGKVRLGLVDKYRVADLLDAEDLQSIPECRELYHRAMVYHALPDRQPGPNEMNRARGCSMALLAINTVVMQYYDRNVMMWLTMPNFNNHSTGRQITGYNPPAAAHQGNFLYVAGGNIQGPTNALSRYDIGRNSWENLASMKSCRFAFRLCIFDGYMYAVGGYSDSGYLSHNNVERYCFRSGHWQFIAPLEQPRFHVAVAHHKGYLYAVGGQKDKFTAVREVQRFDPRSNSWEKASPTKYPHTQAAAVVVGGRLYIAGGRTNGPERNSDLVNCQQVEVYDDLSGAWSVVPQTFVPMCNNLPAVVIDGEVCYVLSGFCYRTGIRAAEDQVYPFDLDDLQSITNYIKGLAVVCIPVNIERLTSSECRNSEV